MNIFIPYSWLKDYLDLKISPEKVAELLSLHSFSVEKIIKDKNDSIFEIEITPNRGDALSVLGIARELRALLGLKLKEKKTKVFKGLDKDKLEIEIKDKKLVPRFSAIVLDNVQIKPSPILVQERLKKVGIRPLNNIIDITNYLMIDRGQPMHAFDFDKIKGGKMIIQESKKGEQIITLDGVKRTLPEGVIIIKDKEGRLIDLCGIMGAKNSEVDENTKKVLLFVQIYDSVRIRKASMALGHRTEAALRFEKGVDFEGVLPGLWQAVDFAQKEAKAVISSELIDIKNINFSPKQILLDEEKINLIAGIKIKNINNILRKLGFQIKGKKVIVPSWRNQDVSLIQDLAEEVIRMYGYSNVPAKLFLGNIPEQVYNNFYYEDLAKDFLKNQGFFECYNYTLSEKETELKVTNPLTKDFTYLRNSLLFQLLEVIDKNKDKKEIIKVFEMGNVFFPRKNNLPYQPLYLALAVKGIKYLEFKGIIEALFEELGIKNQNIIVKNKKDYLTIEFNFEELVKKASKIKKYTPISQFSSIKEDLTLKVPESISYDQIKDVIFQTDSRIKKIEFKYIFKNFLTLSLEYLDIQKQISSQDSQKIREIIFKNLEKIKVYLKE